MRLHAIFPHGNFGALWQLDRKGQAVQAQKLRLDDSDKKPVLRCL